jgi:hypothetical protein
MSGSKLEFLSSGTTQACFKELGNTPDIMDKLQRRDVTGAMFVERRLSNQVGIGWRQHDLHGRLFRSLTISSTVTGSKLLNGDTSLGVMCGCGADAVNVRLFSTLSWKNVEKSSTESTDVIGLGGGCRRVFTARQRACGLWLLSSTVDSQNDVNFDSYSWR